jgi:macrolide-specific efflux system membrane fusion protein
MNAVERPAAPSNASLSSSGARRARRWPGRLAVSFAILAAVGAAAYQVYRTNFATDPLADLLLAEATIGNVEQSVQATGSLRPVQLVAVGAQVSGRITKMNAVIGKRFAADDLVAEIDNLTQQNDLRTAEAALEDARLRRMVARSRREDAR